MTRISAAFREIDLEVRRVVFGVLAITIALMVALPFLQTDDTVALLTALIAAEFVGGVVASLYLTALNATSAIRPRSWILAMLATTAWEVTIGGALLVVVLVVNLSGSRLPPGVGLTFVGMSFVIQQSAPITKALVISLKERSANATPHNRRAGDA